MSIANEPNNQEQQTNNNSKTTQAKVWKSIKKTVAECSAKTATTVSEYSARTATSSKNSKESMSIKKKQNLIVILKKEFGLEYMNLMENNASEEELVACRARAMKEISALREKIAKYEARIAANQEELERKIYAGLPPPAESSATQQPSSAVSTSTSTDNEETSVRVSESNNDEDSSNVSTRSIPGGVEANEIITTSSSTPQAPITPVATEVPVVVLDPNAQVYPEAPVVFLDWNRDRSS